MISIITKELVKKEVSSAETILNECFDMLLDFKHARGNLDEILKNFQPKLAECLYRLMQLYQALQRENKAVISLKSNYSKEEFKSIMESNDKLSKVVRATIELGKNLGDAYIWFFFRDNRTELNMHMQHQATGLYVGGVGGLGELEFIKKTCSIDGLYVLYHGITSVLRIGDFSLYDGKAGIVGVGELKTIQGEGDIVNVSACITLKDPFLKKSTFLEDTEVYDEKLKKLQENFSSLKRQLEKQHELIDGKNQKCIPTESQFYSYEPIDTLSINSPIAINEDKTLLLVACWRKHNNLFENLYCNEDECVFSDEFDKKFGQKLDEIIVPSSEFNVITEGGISPFFDSHIMPALWLPLKDDICRDLYFLNVVVRTFFNAVKLLQRFADDGFHVTRTDGLRGFEISLKTDGDHITLDNFDAVCYLITRCFMNTEDAYGYVLNSFKTFKEAKHKPGTTARFHIHLNNFGYNKEAR